MKTDWLITCKECRMNMVPHDQADETCQACKEVIKQQREWRRDKCVVCRVVRPWVGKVCFACRLRRPV